jgi:type IV secretion system protein VirB10
MADPVPGTAPVVDQRTPPRGVLPRHAQTWLMVGLAVGILAIIVFTGHPPATRPQPGLAVSPTAAASPERLREYQDRLRLLEDRARQQAASPSESSMATRPIPDDRVASPPSPDPAAEDRKRREYESLFSSNVVMSRRPEGQRLMTVSSAPSPALQTNGTNVPPTPPSIDDVAEAVVRATARTAPVQPPDQKLVRPSDISNAPTAAAAPAAAHTPPVSTGPISASGATHRLLEGTLIDAVLTNRLDASSAAPVNCLVTNPVYSHDGGSVLIPAGARVLGVTKPVQTFGETRLAASFDRLLLPDGSTYRLDQFTGLNAIGDAGLRDQVNQHYKATFGASAAIGLITGLAQYLGTGSFAHGNANTVVIAGGVTESTAQATAQTMNRFLNRLPTITIREGHRVKIYLTADLDLPAYDTHTSTSSRR